MKCNIVNFCIVFSHFVLPPLSSVAAAEAPLSFSSYFVMIIVIIIVIILSACPASSPKRWVFKQYCSQDGDQLNLAIALGAQTEDVRNPLHTPTSYLPCNPSSLSSLAWNFVSFYPCVNTVSLLRHHVK